MLEKHFIIDTDYKCLLLNLDEQVSHTHGGHNKEIIIEYLVYVYRNIKYGIHKIYYHLC